MTPNHLSFPYILFAMKKIKKTCDVKNNTPDFSFIVER